MSYANGAIIGLAGIGALAATLPTQYLLNAISWQSMFVWCSVVTIVVALILWFVAFDHPSDLVRNSRSFVDELKGFKAVFRNPVFLVFGPLSILGQGAWLSYQGLWAGAWLREVNNLSALSAAGFLFLLAICVVFGNIVLGVVSGQLATRSRIFYSKIRCDDYCSLYTRSIIDLVRYVKLFTISLGAFWFFCFRANYVLCCLVQCDP